MKKIGLLLLAMAAVAVTAYAAAPKQAAHKHAESKAEKETGEVKVTLAQLPAAVKATLLKVAKGAKIGEIERETVYEAELVVKGKTFEVLIDAEGELLSKKAEKEEKGEAREEKEEKEEAEEKQQHEEKEKAEAREENEEREVKVTLAELPAAVKATLLKETKGGKIELIEKGVENGKTVYEAEVTVKGKKFEISIAPDGKLLSKEPEKE